MDRVSMYRFRLQPTLFFLMAAWLGIVAFAAHMLMSSEIRRAEVRFKEDIRVSVSDVKHKLDTNEAVLSGFAAFLQAVDHSDTNSAMKYAASTKASFPHIYMIEVARKVALADEKSLEDSLRKGWPSGSTCRRMQNGHSKRPWATVASITHRIASCAASRTRWAIG